MSKNPSPEFSPVQVVDEIGDAIAAGNARAAAYYALNPKQTLIDNFTPEQITNWNGSEELAIVSDPDGLDEKDF